MNIMKLFKAAAIALALCAPGLSQAVVRPQDRALIIITELDTGGLRELAPLYSALEDIGAGLPRLPILRQQYREIHVLKDRDATTQKFKAMGLHLASRPEIKAIDVFVMLHGLTNRLLFANGTITPDRLAQFMTTSTNTREARLVLEMKKKFRLLYNTSCFGASHRAGFRQMGFDVVVGSIAVNANAEVEYPSFLTLWNAGANIRDSFAPSNNSVALAAADGPLRLAGQFGNNFLRHIDSRKVFSGDVLMTINSDPR